MLFGDAKESIEKLAAAVKSTLGPRGRNAVLYAGEVDWDAAGLGGRAVTRKSLRGLLAADGARAFPKATIVAQRAEWEIAGAQDDRPLAERCEEATAAAQPHVPPRHG